MPDRSPAGSMAGDRYKPIMIGRKPDRLALGGAALLVGFAGTAACASASRRDGQSSMLPAPPPAILHVTGTPDRFSISADHADVQSVLKYVFDQAGKQF